MDNETKAKGEMETTVGMEEALEELSEMCKHQNEQNESAESELKLHEGRVCLSDV